MKKVIKSLLPVVLLAGSCKHPLSKVAYMQYVHDVRHGLKKSVSTADIEYVVQYKPADMVILMENKGQGKKADIAKRKADLSGSVWFNVVMKVKSGSASPLRYNLASQQEYDSRVNYFLNAARRCIKLRYGNDTLNQIGYVFENSYNLAPQETMVVGFELPRGEQLPVKDMQLSYDDEVFKTGIVKVIFRKEDIEHIPALSYQ